MLVSASLKSNQLCLHCALDIKRHTSCSASAQRFATLLSECGCFRSGISHSSCSLCVTLAVIRRVILSCPNLPQCLHQYMLLSRPGLSSSVLLYLVTLFSLQCILGFIMVIIMLPCSFMMSTLPTMLCSFLLQWCKLFWFSITVIMS